MENETYGTRILPESKAQRYHLDCLLPSIGEPFQPLYWRTLISTNFFANILKSNGSHVRIYARFPILSFQSAHTLLAFQKYGDMDHLKRDALTHLCHL